jgi:aspartate-semialdehyde dehydrogenase
MGNIENGYNIGIVGATGLVGQEFIKILETRKSADLPVEKLRLFASEKSAGKQVIIDGQPYVVEQALPHPELFQGLDFVITAVGDKETKKYSPAISAAGALNVDKSNAWRMDPDVPLVVPEVNPDDAQEHKGIIAGPNCSTIQLVVALWPIHKENPIQRITVDTYQAVSGAGLGGVKQLKDEERGVHPENPAFSHVIYHNVIPEIGGLTGDLFSEEQKMIDETRKIFHVPNLPIDATCVRVPVPTGHSEAVRIELMHPMSPEDAIEILDHAEGVSVYAYPKAYPTPLRFAGEDKVYIGRVRKDESHPRGLSLWIVSDNLRKGAALNAFQVFELVARNGWIQGKRS